MKNLAIIKLARTVVLAFQSMLITGILLLNSCADFVEIDPPRDKLISRTVFDNNVIATAAVTGIYNDMIFVQNGFAAGSQNGISLMTAVSADELRYLFSATPASFYYSNDIISNNTVNALNWNTCFNLLYQANAALEGLSHSTGVSELVRNQLKGEALFIRAFCNFYAVNLWGDIPLVLTTDYRINSNISRTNKVQVYEQIIEDLSQAKSLLSEDYSFSNGQKVRVNRFCASAMLARTYLYQGDWGKAEAEATEVITQTSLYQLSSDLNGVFRSNSNETIWQLLPTSTSYETNDGIELIPISSFSQFFEMTVDLMNAFEAGDVRMKKWVKDSVFSGIRRIIPYKYKINYRAYYNPSFKEYYTVLRLAEQYLVRAEARAHQGNVSGSQDDLNTIRARAGLSNTTASTQAELLNAIMHERQIELFTEWGHRWLDLKRWNKADQILSVIKGNWAATDVLYPIPVSEMLTNPSLTQNPGY